MTAKELGDESMTTKTSGEIANDIVRAAINDHRIPVKQLDQIEALVQLTRAEFAIDDFNRTCGPMESFTKLVVIRDEAIANVKRLIEL